MTNNNQRITTTISDTELEELANAEIRLLRGLPPWERYELLRTSDHAHYKKNSIIFEQGDVVDAIYVIKKGTVKLATFDADGHEQIVGMFGQYDTIWEGVYLNKSYYPYSGICVTDVDVCIIYKQRFENLLRQPDVAMRTIGLLSQKLHDANERNMILSANEPRKRLAGFLQYWQEHNHEEVMKIRLNDIAASTGMRPETVSRKLKEFEKQGLVRRVGQSGIQILNYEALKEIYEI